MDYGKNMNTAHKVPSVLSYSPAPNRERQWGADLSPEAVIHKNMKLQLDVQPKRLDGLELTLEVLEGAGNLSIEHVKRSNQDPAYAHKPPTTIVTDYLTRVFECAWKLIDERSQFGTKKPPVDVVVTVPVVRTGFYETWLRHANETGMVLSSKQCDLQGTQTGRFQ